MLLWSLSQSKSVDTLLAGDGPAPATIAAIVATMGAFQGDVEMQLACTGCLSHLSTSTVATQGILAIGLKAVLKVGRALQSQCRASSFSLPLSPLPPRECLHLDFFRHCH